MEEICKLLYFGRRQRVTAKGAAPASFLFVCVTYRVAVSTSDKNKKLTEEGKIRFQSFSYFRKEYASRKTPKRPGQT